MLVPKYKDMDGEVIVVVLSRNLFFPKYGRDLKEIKGKHEIGLKKKAVG